MQNVADALGIQITEKVSFRPPARSTRSAQRSTRAEKAN